MKTLIIYSVIICYDLLVTEVAKQQGNWSSDGACMAIGNDLTCGVGLQRETRPCTNGTSDICTVDDNERKVECALPDCIG